MSSKSFEAGYFIQEVGRFTLPNELQIFSPELIGCLWIFGTTGAKDSGRFLPDCAMNIVACSVQEKSAAAACAWEVSECYHHKMGCLLSSMRLGGFLPKGAPLAIARYFADNYLKSSVESSLQLQQRSQSTLALVQRFLTVNQYFLHPDDRDFDFEGAITRIEREKDPSIVAREMMDFFDACNSGGGADSRGCIVGRFQGYVASEIILEFPYSYSKAVLEKVAIILADRNDEGTTLIIHFTVAACFCGYEHLMEGGEKFNMQLAVKKVRESRGSV